MVTTGDLPWLRGNQRRGYLDGSAVEQGPTMLSFYRLRGRLCLPIVRWTHISCWLVVTGTWLDYFPFHIWDVILPIDELIFFRGVGQPPISLTLMFFSFGGWSFWVIPCHTYLWPINVVYFEQQDMWSSGQNHWPLQRRIFLLQMPPLKFGFPAFHLWGHDCCI